MYLCPLENSKHKLLHATTWRDVLNGEGPDGRPIGRKGFLERNIVMLLYDRPAAFGGAIRRERGHDDLGRITGSHAQRFEVGLSILT